MRKPPHPVSLFLADGIFNFIMKKVHPSTKRAIILAHEKTQRVLIQVRGRKLVDMTLAEIRAINQMRGFDPTLTIEFAELLPF